MNYRDPSDLQSPYQLFGCAIDVLRRKIFQWARFAGTFVCLVDDRSARDRTSLPALEARAPLAPAPVRDLQPLGEHRDAGLERRPPSGAGTAHRNSPATGDAMNRTVEWFDEARGFGAALTVLQAIPAMANLRDRPVPGSSESGPGQEVRRPRAAGSTICWRRPIWRGSTGTAASESERRTPSSPSSSTIPGPTRSSWERTDAGASIDCSSEARRRNDSAGFPDP